jgi:glycerol-3-phosphate O-acyltransferase
MSKPYPPIIPQLKDWPVYKVARQVDEFKQELKQLAYDTLKEKNKGKIKELMAQCAYMETKRVTQMPWKVDPDNEKPFWNNLHLQLTSGSDCSSEELCDAMLKKIVNRYSEEIVGDFKPDTYLFADRFLSWFFNRIFSSGMKGSFFNFFNRKKAIYEKLKVKGYISETRELFKHGTVVVVPTHQSNLDSILVGFILGHIMGLPAFSYGAGLNLYNYEILAYYMNRLGAYKLDRRKKNAIYHETLFTFLKLSVQKNVNNLFFPAGGRVRDGKLEQNLKLGLLSALIQAQKSSCEKKAEVHKVFVVPVVLNYHFVLEAHPLILDHLAKTGKEKFKNRKKTSSITLWNLIRYAWGIFTKNSDFVLSIGKPLDILGNEVRSDGTSVDSEGKVIEICDYFKLEGEYRPDYQRESIYAKRLGEAVADSYQKHCVVLSSHLIAYLAYQMFKKKYSSDSIFSLISTGLSEFELDLHEILPAVEKMLKHLEDMASKQMIWLDDDLKLSPELLIQTGVKKLGVFHLRKPLKWTKHKTLHCKDVKLLYYYANRLNGFGFEEVIK